jgi:hypothetical protein
MFANKVHSDKVKMIIKSVFMAIDLNSGTNIFSPPYRIRKKISE